MTGVARAAVHQGEHKEQAEGGSSLRQQIEAAR